MRHAIGERGRGNEEAQKRTSVWEALRSVEHTDSISSRSQSEHRATAVMFKTIDNKDDLAGEVDPGISSAGPQRLGITPTTLCVPTKPSRIQGASWHHRPTPPRPYACYTTCVVQSKAHHPLLCTKRGTTRRTTPNAIPSHPCCCPDPLTVRRPWLSSSLPSASGEGTPCPGPPSPRSGRPAS